MSSYFKNFRKVLYLFGDEISPVAIQDLSRYSKVIDDFADQISTYIEYEIKDFERPDSLSHQLYGTSEYDWTFYLMNDKLREQGWPLALQDVYKNAETKIYRDWTCQLDISTADSAAEYADLYPAGSEVFLGSKRLLVKSKNLQVGEITVTSPTYAPDSDFSGITVLQTTSLQTPLKGTVREMFGTHHYENDSGDRVDLYFDDGAKTAKTNLDVLIQRNDELKKIRIIKQNNISSIVGAFKTVAGQ